MVMMIRTITDRPRPDGIVRSVRDDTHEGVRAMARGLRGQTAAPPPDGEDRQHPPSITNSPAAKLMISVVLKITVNPRPQPIGGAQGRAGDRVLQQIRRRRHG